MGLFGLFKKKEVPQELPALALDDINKESPVLQTLKEETVQKTIEQKQLEPSLEQNQDVVVLQPQTEIKPVELEQSFAPPHSQHFAPITPPVEILTKEEKGFFRDLLFELGKQEKNVEKLDRWYELKFKEEEDTVTKMKEYWENNKPELIFKNIGGELKQNIISKAQNLQKLEKEWQEIYYTLLTKEEKIREEEKELKKVLKEFIELCRKTSPKGKKSKD